MIVVIGPQARSLIVEPATRNQCPGVTTLYFGAANGDCPACKHSTPPRSGLVIADIRRQQRLLYMRPHLTAYTQPLEQVISFVQSLEPPSKQKTNHGSSYLHPISNRPGSRRACQKALYRCCSGVLQVIRSRFPEGFPACAR